MRRILLSTIAFMALSGNALAATDPGLQVTKPIYEWKTESEVDKDTKVFNHCLVKNMYDNGTVIMLAENYDGVQRLALHFPQDKMQAGQHYDLTLQVDKRDLFPVEAVAVSPQILTIGIPQAFPDQMRKGQAMYLRGPNDEVVYMLNGADGAVAALRDCVLTNRNLASGIQVAENEHNKNDDEKELTIAPVKETEEPAPKPAHEAVKSDEKPLVVAAAEPVALPEPKKEDLKKEAAEVTAPVKEQAKEEAKEEKSAPKEAEKKEEKKEEKPAAKVVEKPTEKPPEPKPTSVAGVPVQPAPPAPSVADNIKSLAQKLEPEKKIDIAQPLLPDALAATMATAGLTPSQMIAKPDGSTNKPLDYAWLKENLFIGVKQQPRVPDAELANAATYYMKIMKQRCGGPFVAEAALPQRSNKAYWVVAETACSTTRTGDTIAALLFANDAKGMTVYFIEAPAKDGAKAIKARDAVLTAAIK
jgi:hypothetical protein